MNIILIGFTKISLMPYINFYLNIIDRKKHRVSILFWERDTFEDKQLPSDIKVYTFKKAMNDSTKLILKIPYFLAYRKFARKILKSNDYDLVISLHTTPAILLFDLLIYNFSFKFVLDYRDKTYEKFWFYKFLIKRLVLSSKITFVSSPGFLSVLPKSKKIYLIHNYSFYNKNLDYSKKFINTQLSKVIKIRFWGLLRHPNFNKIIIDNFGNNKNFELHYHGREQRDGDTLKNYVLKKKYQNIYFHGYYKPEHVSLFAFDTQLLLNMYGNDGNMQFALGNKFYDGIIFKIPQICSKDSFMGNEVEKYAIGISLNPNEKDFISKLLDYYQNLDFKKFYNNCEAINSKIVAEFENSKSVFISLGLNGEEG